MSRAFYVYRKLNNDKVIKELIEYLESGTCDNTLLIGLLLENGEKMGFRGNLINDYIAYLLALDENAYTLMAERRGRVGGCVEKVLLKDIALIREIMALSGDSEFCKGDVSLLMDFMNDNEHEKYFNHRIRDGLEKLALALSNSADNETFLDELGNYYARNGVGEFGLFKAFRIKDDELAPIITTEHMRFDDLIGYEMQKEMLRNNTEAFLRGEPANNCLLFGDAGTGKSSSIKALLNEYYDEGLRMIEVYKHQFKSLDHIVEQIKDRNYRFIIYMDDLSFEDFEIEYKYLKAVIEGGLAKRSGNLLIYATSNRRHLIRERYSEKLERDEDMNTRDTVQEKLSLADRFGLKIFYGVPDKKGFNNIVLTLARREGITLSDEELYEEANKWQVSHGSFSGRTARQFINYLRS